MSLDYVADSGNSLSLFEKQNNETLMDKKQLAARLNISVKMIDKLMALKSIPYIKMEKSVRFSWRDIEGWLQKRKHNVD